MIMCRERRQAVFGKRFVMSETAQEAESVCQLSARKNGSLLD